MDGPGTARRWADIDRALGELSLRHSEIEPVVINQRRQTMHLASGEVIELGPLLVDLIHCPPTMGQAVALAYLHEATAAARDLSNLTVGSWPDMATRLGLTLRRRHSELIGPSVGPDLLLAVMIDAGSSLIPVTGDLVRRWNRPSSIVTDIAASNTIHQPIEFREIYLRLRSYPGLRAARCKARLALGGSFTTGLLVEVGSVSGPIGSGGVLATCLGDRALLVAPADGGPAGSGLANLAHALQNTAVDLRRTMSIRPSFHGDAILRCRSSGQVAIFRTGGVGE